MRVPSNAPVYVRSFAARDRLGGLSREAFLAVFLLRHLCDVVLVETVGVGQNETDVVNLADTVVLVIQPFAGDLIQFIKAGVMEIPDILAVNKADDAALARKAVADVKAALALDRQLSRVSVGENSERSVPSTQPWSSPVLAVSAAANLNLDALHEAIAAHHSHLVATGTLESRRVEQAIAWVMGEIQVEVGRAGLEALGGIPGVKTLWARQPATWSAARRLKVLLGSVSYGVK
jgi:LAO/AO transport system kinase